ncbi:hypothetical protein [Nonomuraea sp. NPDC049480]|uniref:hypothetical protein n=1 Tax=Nonomuraea sp. NPDC049480 TaxID=3364353 RepID=UPI00379FAD50
MAVHVAVVDRLPMYREGVAAVLSAAGHAVETPADVLSWVRHGQRRVVLLTLEREHDWELLRNLCHTGGTHVVIALIGEESAALGAQAIHVGARSVLPRGVTAGMLRRTVEATSEGQSVMPAVVATALAAGTGRAGAAPTSLTTQKVSWLRQLAEGSTVAQLARRVGYSERAMFRLLQALYQEMGVSTRIQAIVRAQEEGWLRAEADSPEDVRAGFRRTSG